MDTIHEIELPIGGSIVIGNQVLTLVDIEGELCLIHLDEDSVPCAVRENDLHELLAVGSDYPGLPR